MCAAGRQAEGKFDMVSKIAVSDRMTLSCVFSDRPLERFATGSTLFHEGDEARHVFEVVEGVLRVFRSLSDGRRAITGFLYPGSLVGVSMRDEYLCGVEAIGKVAVRRLPSNVFQEAVNHTPQLLPALFAVLCDEMAIAQNQMVLLSRKTAEERISTFLLSLASLSAAKGNHCSIDVPMTRLDMADYLGLTIETVSRTLTSLVSRGLITLVGRHSIGVKKFETLRRLAGEAGFAEEDNVGRRYGAQGRMAA